MTEEQRAKHSERCRRWRLANPERVKANSARSNPRRVYDARAERLRKASRKEYLTEYHANYRKRNRVAVLCSNHERRARLANAPGLGVTAAQWRDVLAEYGWRCAYCAQPGRQTMDHVAPLVKGGSHDVSNVVPACSRCNTSKNATSLLFWVAKKPVALTQGV